jgi:hypothetical protein
MLGGPDERSRNETDGQLSGGKKTDLSHSWQKQFAAPSANHKGAYNVDEGQHGARHVRPASKESANGPLHSAKRRGSSCRSQKTSS